MSGVNFTMEAAKRIAAAVRRVEQQAKSVNADRTPQREQGASFWAYLAGCDATGKRYSWIQVVPLQGTDTTEFTIFRDDMVWTFAEPEVSGEFNAVEVNGTRGIDPDTIVRLMFSGYNSNGDPLYLFQYTLPPQQNGIPAHDHRSNTQGGFAFSCYHPGTSLPQMEWGV